MRRRRARFGSIIARVKTAGPMVPISRWASRMKFPLRIWHSRDQMRSALSSILQMVKNLMLNFLPEFLGAYFARNCGLKRTFFCQYEVKKTHFLIHENKNLLRLLFVDVRNSNSRRCSESSTILLEYTSEECDPKCLSFSV